MINIKYEENKINELNILERQYMMKKEQFNNIINQKDEKINVLENNNQQIVDLQKKIIELMKNNELKDKIIKEKDDIIKNDKIKINQLEKEMENLNKIEMNQKLMSERYDNIINTLKIEFNKTKENIIKEKKDIEKIRIKIERIKKEDWRNNLTFIMDKETKKPLNEEKFKI